jgi:hypothetical protein
MKMNSCLTKHDANKMYGGVEVQFHAFFTSALLEVNGQLHAPATLPPEKDPRYALARRLGGPRNRSVRGNVIIRRPFEKFVDSSYYSESELCGGAVTVSFRSTCLGKRHTSYNAPPTSSVLQTVDHFEISCLGAPFSRLKKLRNRMGLYDRCSNGAPPIHFFQAEHRIQFRSRPIRFLGFSNHEKGAPRQGISK